MPSLRAVLSIAVLLTPFLVPSRASGACYPALPQPTLEVTGNERYFDAFGDEFIRYRMDVTNRSAFPDELFEAAPDLPACGLNTDSSRTWVDVFAGNGTRLYGFCGLGSAADLSRIWFAVPIGRSPPDQVYVTLTDRRCGLTYTSNLASTSVDSDGDALSDAVELSGVDADGDGVIDVDLAALGASALRRDLFLELDCLVAHTGTGAIQHSHCPLQNAVERVVRSFADAPVSNADGTAGVQLHVDTGPLYGAGRVFSVAGGGGVTGTYGDLAPGAPRRGGDPIDEAGNEIVDWDGTAGNPATSYFTLKGANFDPNRATVFRYGLFIHQTNARAAANDCTSGWGGGDDFMVSLGGTRATGTPCWGTDAGGFSVGTEAQQAGTFQHEYGHALSLGHGGGDGINLKPNYLSLMSYAFQMCSVTSNPPGLPGGCDYSRRQLPTLWERLNPPASPGLDECSGVDGGAYGLGAVDFNRNGLLEGATCAPPNTGNVWADVNGDSACVSAGPDGVLQTVAGGDDATAPGIIRDGPNLRCDSVAAGDDLQQKAFNASQPAPLPGFDDWSHLGYPTRALLAAPGAPPTPVIDADPEAIASARRVVADVTEPILAVTVSGPASALPGQLVSFDVRASNSLSSGSRGPAMNARMTDTGPDGSTQTLELGKVVLETAQTRTVQFEVPRDACPGDWRNRAAVTYENLIGDRKSTAADVPLQVLDRAAPTVVEVSASPSVLWPPNSKMVEVTVRATATDDCTASPTCRVTSVSANGRARPGAWEIVDATHVRLRAQRFGWERDRRYRIVVTCTDASGNSVAAPVFVRVAHDRRTGQGR